MKIELERWEICRIISLLTSDIRDNERLLDDGNTTEFDTLLKSTIDEDSCIIDRLKMAMEGTR